MPACALVLKKYWSLKLCQKGKRNKNVMETITRFSVTSTQSACQLKHLFACFAFWARLKLNLIIITGKLKIIRVIRYHTFWMFFFRAQSHYYFFAEKFNWEMSPHAFHSHVARKVKALQRCSLNNSWRTCLYKKVYFSGFECYTPHNVEEEEFVC